VTLYNPGTSFFGRTYRGRPLPLSPIQDSAELRLEDTDWVAFYTQAKTMKTKAIVEVIMIETDILKGSHRAKGIGYADVPLFFDEMPEFVQIFKGSPRDLLKYAGDAGYEPPVTNS